MEVLGLMEESPEVQLGMSILIYAGRGLSLATVHPVIIDSQTRKARLGDARAMTREGMQLLVSHISGHGPGYERDIWPGNILIAEYGIVAWWLPSRRRPIFFDTRTTIDAEFAGKSPLHPPLLLVGKPGHLSVYAMQEDRRPDRDTLLYRAPYLNLYAMGTMCPGQIALPSAALPSEIDDYTNAFFDSSFTHANTGVQEHCAYFGGHNALWRAMMDETVETFPVDCLISLEQNGEPLTVRRAINQ